MFQKRSAEPQKRDRFFQRLLGPGVLDDKTPKERPTLLRSSRRPLPNWPTASLRTYLVIVILLATVPIATLMTYQIFDQIRAQRLRMQEGIQRSAAVLSQSVNRELSSSIDALSILSYSGEIQHGNVEQFQEALMRRPLMRQSWSSIYLLSLDGEVLFDTARPRQKQPNVRDIKGLLRKLTEQEAVVSNLVMMPDGSYATTVEVPIPIDNVPRYVLGARIQAPVWQQLVRESGQAAPGVSTIIDRDFHVIARNRLAERFVGNVVPSSNQNVIRRGPYGTGTLLSLEGGSIYTSWETVPLSGWIVFTGIPSEPIDVAHRQAITGALATAAACLALGVLLALLVARRMTRPLHQLARNDLSQPMDRIAVREISLLRDALVAAKAHDEMTRELIRNKRDLLGKKADEFETLLASSPIGLAFAQDRLCRTVTHNAAMDALFGKLDAHGNVEVTVLHEGKVLPREAQPLQRAAAYGATTRGMELEIRVDGRPPSFVIVNAVPLRDEDGEPRGAIGAVVDITDRKADEARLIIAEQRLRESQHLVDLAQETGHVGFFHYQVQERRLTSTPGQIKLFGFQPDEQADSLPAWVERIDHADWRRILLRLHRAFRSAREMETLDYSVHQPDGSERWLSSRVRLVYTPDGNPQHVIGVTVDMTEQKNAEKERDALIGAEQTARIEAETANRAKDEFLAMLGHELRNPLSAIASGIEVLNRVEGDSDVAKNARQIIDRQTRHLAHMVDDLLDVARVLTGKVVLLRHGVNLGSLVQRVIDTLQIAKRFDDHILVHNIEDAWINASTTRIEQVVSNLLVNAVKYTPPKGRIEVRVAQEGNEAVLEVKDNGVGISPDLLPRVFDLFVQGERTLDRRGGGLGVGLTLVRRLVELHDGTIVAANANPGTIMTVRLPVIDPPVVEEDNQWRSQKRKRSVAVIEDNQDVLQGLCNMLRLEGHTVWTAADGIGGLDLIVGRRPEVAIVDIGLPGITGYEVARQSRGKGYAGKMIALSGYGQEQDKKQAMAAGFDVHFLKPVQFQDLLNVLNQD